MKDTQTQEEEYIIAESQELRSEDVSFIERFFKAFPALTHRNYQLFFFGQTFSLVGTWIQMVALGWLVWELTRSAFYVGLVSALGGLPTLLFSLFGGVIVDRFPKKKILLITQFMEMILAFILAILTITNIINVWEIVVLSFLAGLVTAVDMPARQAFTIEMVGKKDLSSAIALNAGMWNGARVIGPAVAGTIIYFLGTGSAFLINALSFLAVIIALLLIRVKHFLPSIHPHPLRAIQDGLSYAFSHPIIKTFLLFAAVASIFGWSHATLMPVIVEKIFHRGADFLGFFYSVQGVGAVAATIIASTLSKKVSPIKFILSGSFIFVISIILFTFTTNPFYAFPFLFLSGFGIILQFSMLNSVIQHTVEDSYRGRVMSIYTVMFLGFMPIGSFQIGFFAEHFGVYSAIRLGAIIVFIFTLYLFFKKNKLQEIYFQHV